MAPQTKSGVSSAYTPDIELPPPDARDARHPWWKLLLRPTELVAAIALLLGVLTFLGVRWPSADAMETRVTRVEHRVDTLYEQVRFSNFLQCVSFRLDHPELVPPDCAPIIESQRTRDRRSP